MDVGSSKKLSGGLRLDEGGMFLRLRLSGMWRMGFPDDMIP